MAKARKEIDKDAMYQKIMPSSMRAAPPEEAPELPAPGKRPGATAPRPRKPTVAASAGAVHAPSGAPQPAGLAAAPHHQREPEYPDEARYPHEPVYTPQAVPPPVVPQGVQQAAAPQKPAVINIMEQMIAEKLESAMEKFRCCNCSKCKQDITALALNRLKPRYIINEPIAIAEALDDKEANTQVTTALVQAILKVKSNPSH
ncbi:MAG: late competence development ComFB family protein [Angelakisella sp.]